MKNSINWLHLTDRHFRADGKPNNGWLRTTPHTDRFVGDIKAFVEERPLDLIIFTGDLAWSGNGKEYQIASVAIESLFKEIESVQGYFPKLLVAPGNHDISWLQRQGKSTYTSLLDAVNGNVANPDSDLIADHLNDPESPVRTELWKLFEEYRSWYNNCPYAVNASTQDESNSFDEGVLPGEFYSTIKFEVGADQVFSLGFACLNSSIAHLGKETDKVKHKGRMLMYQEQFEGVPGGSLRTWRDNHDINILLTHHPLDWIEPKRLQTLKTLYLTSSTYFDLHLHGHAHEGRYQSIQSGSADQNARDIGYQAKAIYGDDYEDPTLKYREGRPQGYCFGGIELFEEKKQELVLRPRQLRTTNYGPRVIPDYDGCELSLTTAAYSVPFGLKDFRTIKTDVSGGFASPSKEEQTPIGSHFEKLGKERKNVALAPQTATSKLYVRFKDRIHDLVEHDRFPIKVSTDSKAQMKNRNNITIVTITQNILNKQVAPKCLKTANGDEPIECERGAGDYDVYKQNSDSSIQIRESIKSALIQVESEISEIDLICFGEFSYPDKLPSQERTEFDRWIFEYCQRNSCMVMLGSFHDKGCYNVTPIYYPANDSDLPIKHAKNVSDRKGGGLKNRTPSSKSLRVYDSPVGKLGVFLCRDTFDASAMFSMFDATFKGDYPVRAYEKQYQVYDIVAIPAYASPSRASQIRSACKDVSFISGGISVFINSMAGQKTPPKSNIFLAGDSLDDIEKDGRQLATVIQLTNDDCEISSFVLEKQTWEDYRLQIRDLVLTPQEKYGFTGGRNSTFSSTNISG